MEYGLTSLVLLVHMHFEDVLNYEGFREGVLSASQLRTQYLDLLNLV